MGVYSQKVTLSVLCYCRRQPNPRDKTKKQKSILSNSPKRSFGRKVLGTFFLKGAKREFLRCLFRKATVASKAQKEPIRTIFDQKRCAPRKEHIFLKVVSFCNDYQLAFFTPGIRPFEAISRNWIRLIPNWRI